MNIDDSQPVVDLSKPVQTRDGREVRIYTTEGKDPEHPIVAEFQAANGTWWLVKRPLHGRICDGRETGDDIVNVPQQHTVTVNVYRRINGSLGYIAHSSRDDADHAANYCCRTGSVSRRIACFARTFTEGEGLE